MRLFRVALLGVLACVLGSATASAQVQTGSITGTVTDTSDAVLPGVTVSLSGEKLIGGVQTQTTTPTGDYRFDRLPPGAYRLKFELQGFKTVERADIRVSASFVATVNAKLGIGELNETLTVRGESPTVDTRSNVQQTIMSQEVLEGVPSGRDPWSVAKIIPGVAISTYDVGGTQSFQQSSLSSHGSSTNDVSYKIDGATVNWPGGGGGATMLYYDQGMFEEVNYQTSAIPAEVMTGGVSINMVTKEAGNKWRGGLRFSYANDSFQSDNWSNEPALQKWSFIGNPTNRAFDVNVDGGGALVQDKLWVSGSARRWGVNLLTAAKNPDGSRAIDDNNLKNFSGKAVWQITPDQKVSASFNYDNKIRGHRRDTPPVFVPDIASWVQRNPASTTQAKYTGIRNRIVFESAFSAMLGETDYEYQQGVSPTTLRVTDPVLSTANSAAPYREELPNSRIQWDNVLAYSKTGWGGDHLFKVGAQYARLRLLDQYWINGDMWLVYNNGLPTSVTIYNTPAAGDNVENIVGIFAQDSWTIANRLTLNLGARFDTNRGYLPAISSPAGTFVGARRIDKTNVINQNIAVWRAGAVYDPSGDGKTALKASYGRYALQVGVDRVQNVNPFFLTSASCPWSDPNLDGIAQPNEIGACSGFPGLTRHYQTAEGPSWPYSDEVSAGVERQVGPDVRIGLMYYHRTNRDQVGTLNLAVPSSAYTPFTVAVPGGAIGPGGTATFYDLNPTALGRQNNVITNVPYLDTDYNGVELTASKRFSRRWQLLAGLTIGRNKGGVNDPGAVGQVATSDLNDPNLTRFPNGIVGYDSKYAFRVAGSYVIPGDVTTAASLISNGGYPYVSTYSVTRTVFPTLTRSSQTVFLSGRGDERLPNVTMLDLRVSRPFHVGGNGLQIVPQIDLFNVTNVSTIVGINGGVGSSYLKPTQIVAPRIVRVGFNVQF